MGIVRVDAERIKTLGRALLDRRCRVCAGTLLFALGCALPSPADRELPREGELSRWATEAIERTWAVYLYADRLDHRMLRGALDALEQRFDSVRFDEGSPADTAGTLWVGAEGARVPFPERPVDPSQFMKILSRALRFVSSRLGEELQIELANADLEEIALSGALAALDQYSTIVANRAAEDFGIRFGEDRRVGIGLRIGREDGKLIAVEVFPEGPAARGDLLSGDEILKVDGNDVTLLTTEEAVDLIRGEAGTAVQLDVRRNTTRTEIAPALRLSITRGAVKIPTVEARALEGGVAYARIRQVAGNTAEEFYTKLRALGEIHGLVIDLRGNTGGSLREAARLADLFLSSGTIFRVLDRNGDVAERGIGTAPATPPVAFPSPIAVLVDRATAAAAEIVAGALAPLENVTLLGQQTLGAGLIQSVVKLPGENLLKLTVGELRLSEDRVIHGAGLLPDLVLYPVARRNLASLAERPEGAVPYLVAAGNEYSLDDRVVELARRVVSEGREKAADEFGARTQLS